MSRGLAGLNLGADEGGGTDAVGWELAGVSEAERIDVLYRAYARRLRLVCMGRLGSAHDADDAVQEAVLRASRAWATFRPGADPWPWIRTIATNVCHDMHRSERRRQRVTVDDQSVDVADIVLSKLRTTAVQSALQELAEPARSTVALRELEGWSYADIASLQGRSLAAVRTTLMRGRRQLKDKLQRMADNGSLPLPAAIGLQWRRLLATAGRRQREIAGGGEALVGSFAQLSVAVATAALVAGVGLAAVVARPAQSMTVVRNEPFRAASVRDHRAAEAADDTFSAQPQTKPAPPSRSGRSFEVEAEVPAPTPIAAKTEVSAPTGGSTRATFSGRVAEAVDGWASSETELDCDYSNLRQAACDAVDAALPGG